MMKRVRLLSVNIMQIKMHASVKQYAFQIHRNKKNRQTCLFNAITPYFCFMNAIEEKILNTAHRLFYTQGYHNTGINQVIEEAEVAKASLYKYFPSKQDLCSAYLNYRAKTWIKGLQQQAASSSNRKEQLVKVYEFVQRFLTSGSFRGCAFQNLVSEIKPVEDEVIQKEIKRIKVLIRIFFHQLVAEDKDFVTREEEKTGDALYALYEGAMISFQIHQELWPVEAALQASLDLLDKK